MELCFETMMKRLLVTILFHHKLRVLLEVRDEGAKKHLILQQPKHARLAFVYSYLLLHLAITIRSTDSKNSIEIMEKTNTRRLLLCADQRKIYKCFMIQ